jgi:hypothetical protein
MDEAKVEEFRSKLNVLEDELKAHAAEVADPKCAALCETSAEVVGGLKTAFDHFVTKEEKAWQ